jgi:hypothetical protein
MPVMRIWVARLLIGIVTVWNLQAAVIFFFSPASFVLAYELSGEVGEAAVRGVGLLFLMWNVPYMFALLNPIRYKLGLVFAVLMQLIGLIGESYILSTLSADHAVLRDSIFRFIVFDGMGLLLLIAAYLLIKDESNSG